MSAGSVPLAAAPCPVHDDGGAAAPSAPPAQRRAARRGGRRSRRPSRAAGRAALARSAAPGNACAGLPPGVNMRPCSDAPPPASRQAAPGAIGRRSGPRLARRPPAPFALPPVQAQLFRPPRAALPRPRASWRSSLRAQCAGFPPLPPCRGPAFPAGAARRQGTARACSALSDVAAARQAAGLWRAAAIGHCRTFSPPPPRSPDHDGVIVQAHSGARRCRGGHQAALRQALGRRRKSRGGRPRARRSRAAGAAWAGLWE